MKRRPKMPTAIVIGPALLPRPMTVLCEDFSLLVRGPRRLRLARGQFKVLH